MRNLIFIVEGFILAVVGVGLAFNIRIGEEFDGLIRFLEYNNVLNLI